MENNLFKNKAVHIVIRGFIPIFINTIILKLAPCFDIRAESGGLLKLFLRYIPTEIFGNAFFQGTAFWVFFHFLVGYFMVVIYIFIFKPIVSVNWWLKGFFFSFIPWLINSFIVLPMLGQGIMGFKILQLNGVMYFFISNLVFAMILGYIFEKDM